ncbi:MAG: hypothetical protein H6555_11015 [Lewinellaceae bacterium]|nr:hypothetical protein [Lewinellaceae bacterium]
MFTFIDQCRKITAFHWLYWATRMGMGITFILSGIRKLPGIEFTILPVTNPVGAFFHAMHETGLYWNFIGYFQIAIGFLIFSNRFRVLAGLLMMPVTVNIFLVSVALHMRGTPIITAMMLLGNIFLLLWHYENYLPVVKRSIFVQVKKAGTEH